MPRLKWETVKKFSDGYIQAEITCSDDIDKHGNKVKRYSWCLNKLLANGNTSKFFTAGDSPAVMRLTEKCETWISEAESENHLTSSD